MNSYLGNFIVEDGTQFLQGPWYSDGIKYQYKLIETDGAIDYCDIDQMVLWKIIPKKMITR